jgi:integrase
MMPRPTTLVELRDRYLETNVASLEERTLDTARLHFKHLVRTLGEQFTISELTLADLQKHVDRRAKVKVRGKYIGEATLRKEIVTLRTAWNWGAKMGLVPKDYPNDGLRFPKGEEKPPFQTIDEIKRRVISLSRPQAKLLWEALYLRVEEVTALLECVKREALHPWVYPLVCVAAHTGARRSELIRMRISDVDFEGDVLVITEKKRVQGKTSTRRAPLTPTVKTALQEWLAMHPGGDALFCHVGEVARSKKRSPTTGHQNGEGRATTVQGRAATIHPRNTPPFGPLTTGEVHDHFKRALAGTPWSVVRGLHALRQLHALRHSFISGLAAVGVDQRIIDDIVGHQSEAMRRRYRHLTPAAKSQAVAAVFG